MSSFNWQYEAEKKWDGFAESWNERSRNMWDKGSRKDIIPFIEKNLAEQANILDVGCGDGYGSFKLYNSGYAVSGIDISSEMIALAKKQFANEKITFLKGDVTDLPFDDNHFDGIMAINVLEWTENPQKALLELRRILNDNGLLFVGLLGPTAGPRINSYSRLYGKRTICNTMMPWEFQKLALENGFKYIDGFGVYKQGVKEQHYQDLSLELKQALTFMWVFMLKKVGDHS